MRDLDTKNNFCIIIMMSLSKKTPMIVQVTLATACLLVWGIKATYLLCSRQCFQYKNTLCFQKYRVTTKKTLLLTESKYRNLHSPSIFPWK